jgi:hypothetical protein
MTSLAILAEAIANVLRRKRAERLGLERQLADYSRKREAPPEGLGSEFDAVRREIRSLEAALAILAAE